MSDFAKRFRRERDRDALPRGSFVLRGGLEEEKIVLDEQKSIDEWNVDLLKDILLKAARREKGVDVVVFTKIGNAAAGTLDLDLQQLFDELQQEGLHLELRLLIVDAVSHDICFEVPLFERRECVTLNELEREAC